MPLVVLAIHNKLLSQAIALAFLSECSRNVNLTVSPVTVYDLSPVSANSCDKPHRNVRYFTCFGRGQILRYGKPSSWVVSAPDLGAKLIKSSFSKR